MNLKKLRFLAVVTLGIWVILCWLLFREAHPEVFSSIALEGCVSLGMDRTDINEKLEQRGYPYRYIRDVSYEMETVGYETQEAPPDDTMTHYHLFVKYNWFGKAVSARGWPRRFLTPNGEVAYGATPTDVKGSLGKPSSEALSLQDLYFTYTNLKLKLCFEKMDDGNYRLHDVRLGCCD